MVEKKLYVTEEEGETLSFPYTPDFRPAFGIISD